MWRSLGSLIVVPDTNVLLNFGIVNALDLFEAVYGRVVIIRDVFKEVESEPPRSLLYSFIRRRQFGFHTLRETEEVKLRESFRMRLDPGESSVLAYISNRKNAVAVTDERAVRKICEHSFDGRKTGTVGILAACVMHDHINKKDALRIHSRMIDEANAWSPHDRLSELLDQM